MMNLSQLLNRTKDLCHDANRTIDGILKYQLISNFGKSSVATESGGIYPIFRIFTPVKPEKGRKLNSYYGTSFNSYKDTLMDYPTIIAYKLHKNEKTDWKNFNRLISVHVAQCPINCWHCYLEECLKSECSYCNVNSDCKQKRKDPKNGLLIEKNWFSSQNIVDIFLEQREMDRSNNIETNVLRVTGGEPFLIPKMLLEILEELKRRGLSDEIFLWTETNLVPLLLKNDNEYCITNAILKKLAKFENFCVHPCFHGLTAKNFEDNTKVPKNDAPNLLQALERMVNTKIDIYPTFGSNVSDPNDIEKFYYQIAKINKNLPLRFNLIEYDLDYEPVKWRRKYVTGYATNHRQVYDRFQVIDKWEQLLLENTLKRYAEVPRHLVRM